MLGGLGGIAAGEARLQAQHRLRVQLRDARLGHPEHLADLAQRQLLVVVERDDELLALGQPGDRLAERLLQLGLLERDSGSGRVVSSIVSISETWSPPADGVQSSSSAAIDEREISPRLLLQLVGRDPDLGGDLLVGRGAHQRPLELGDRALDLARARAHRARHPVERAELVDDRALDARDRVRLELDLAVRVEALDRADQAEQPVRDEILLVDVRRERPRRAGRRRT